MLLDRIKCWSIPGRQLEWWWREREEVVHCAYNTILSHWMLGLCTRPICNVIKWFPDNEIAITVRQTLTLSFTFCRSLSLSRPFSLALAFIHLVKCVRYLLYSLWNNYYYFASICSHYFIQLTDICFVFPDEFLLSWLLLSSLQCYNLCEY